ncbi:peptidase [Micromonospora sp. NBC_01655]|uniref:peptidase n=1 Tax=Micromonospora sp. NBC_01655 TaxID=2975983 RepID=UPI00224FC4B5|nr:peptidase [Micromonospora sp. NBC_01655]MCX4474485.1 peptidase [Micromonospora sp. NBC_01655]
MRTPLIRSGAALAAATALALPAGPALAGPPPAARDALAAPTPSPGAATVTKAGTSFLTATAITAGQPVQVGASTGDHLYWSFPGRAGQIHEIAATVGFPKGRTGASTWTVEVFDGLRRRQACTAGAQTPTATAAATSVTLGCTLRQVRSWAEPWSADPLPGTYYVRLSVVDLPEPDLGLPVDVDLLVSDVGDGDAPADDGELKAPLVPNTKAGTVLTGEPAAAPAEEEDESLLTGWLPEGSSRWIWTTVGGVLAAVAGVVGFALTRRPRRP